jgi:hypothetical protein
LPTLQSQLESLAESFAVQVLAALRAAPLDELVDRGTSAAQPRRPRTTTGGGGGGMTDPFSLPQGNRKGGRLPRRTAAEIHALLGKIVLLVKTHREGMRAEQIRAALGLQSKEMPRVLKEGVRAKKLRTKGPKRATTYFAR